MATMATASVTIADISDGLDGTGISSTKIEYQAGSSGTSAPTGTWSTSVPSTSASAPYLWTRVTYNYSDGRNPEYVYSVGSTPEGIEIGGRNLLPKAKYGDNIKNISNNSVSGYGYIFSEQSTSPNPIWSSELNLQPGVSYTLSFIAWIDVSDSDAIQALCVDLSPDTLPQKNYDWTNGVTNVPTKFVWTFKSTHSDMLSCRLRFFCDISSPDGYKFKYVPLYITDIKLEEGNKATAWIPAPEDVDEAINRVDVKTEQLDDKLHWMVKSGTSATDFTLTDRVASLLSTEFNIDALTTFKNSAENGTSTVINGGSIKSNSIKADKIDTKDLFAQSITATGTITGGSFVGSSFEGATGSFTGSVTATSGRIGFMDVTSTDISLDKGNKYGEFTLSNEKYIKMATYDDTGAGKASYLSTSSFSMSKKKQYEFGNYRQYGIDVTPSEFLIRNFNTSGGVVSSTSIKPGEIATKNISISGDVKFTSGESVKKSVKKSVRAYELTIGDITINSGNPFSMSIASVLSSLGGNLVGACLKKCWPHSTWAFSNTLLLNGTDLYISTTTTQVYNVSVVIFYTLG